MEEPNELGFSSLSYWWFFSVFLVVFVSDCNDDGGGGGQYQTTIVNYSCSNWCQILGGCWLGCGIIQFQGDLNLNLSSHTHTQAHLLFLLSCTHDRQRTD